MEIKINAIHFDATEKLNDFINKKVEKLGKYNEEIATAEVVLKVVKPETAMNKEASVRLNVPRSEDLFASKVADTFEEAVSDCVDSMEGQIDKYKERYK
jgi:ribosomal subunit interface protein